MSFPGRVIVYGGKGALGSACVKYFKSKNWWVGSIDLNENTEANVNIILKNCDNLLDQETELLEKIDSVLSKQKVDAVICVAGGWAGGNSSSNDFVKNTDLMIKQSIWSSILAAKLASKYLSEGGLLTLTGAKVALDGGTPGMIGYGLAKASIHHLTKSLSQNDSGLPKDSSVFSILPITLDTEMNRKWMPKADYTCWTPLDFISNLLFKWSNKQERPENGSLVQLITKNSETSLVLN